MKKIIGMLLLFSTAVFARELTLDEAINMALKNSREIKTSELSRENSQLNLQRAFKTALPTVMYDGSYQRSEYGRTIDQEKNRKRGYQQSIGIYQPLFQGGAILAGIQGAKSYENMANLMYLAEKRDIRLETIEIYSNIVRLEKNLVVLETSKKELEARHKKQKMQLDMRLITKADLLKTEYNILEVESNIIATNNSIEIAKKNLKVKLQLPEKETIEVKAFTIPEDLLSKIDFQEDLTGALKNSISAKIAKDKVNVAAAEKTVARADLLPKVQAFAKYGTYEKKHFDESVNDASWTGGVSVSWNVFEFGKGYDSYKISRNKEEIEELNKSITTDNIEIKVTNNYLDLVRLDKLRNSRKKALEAARENFKMDTERYNVGLISTVDYLISETQVRQAAVDYNTVVIDYLVAFEKYRSALI
ncbi:outer membrane factor, OMF family [Cetobacterium ceti]|uniref:Outer membrane factor, OMF family n=1 Tax=Cetobacterium ceti TaxID=180163 RepID=A0A1T4JW90_9FUSO|nr:TolC family protein [Cetobacterium ceti]SJZ34404.1 outer membrane factor, OMF family [Cetobacterium ceti]